MSQMVKNNFIILSVIFLMLSVASCTNSDKKDIDFPEEEIIIEKKVKKNEFNADSLFSDNSKFDKFK